MVNRVSECVYTLSYQPNCTRLKISFSDIYFTHINRSYCRKYMLLRVLILFVLNVCDTLMSSVITSP